MSSVKAVCFDLGGVLVQINHTWPDAMKAAGVAPNGVVLHDHTLSGCPLFDVYQDGRTDDETYVTALAKHLGVKVEDAKEAHKAILGQPYPGTPDLIDELNALGVRTGLLSNTNAIHWVMCHTEERFSHAMRLNVQVVSQEVGCSKPEEAIFRAFEDVIGFKGADIAYFDDSRANINAALKLGWNAFWIDYKQPTEPQMRQALRGVGFRV